MGDRSNIGIRQGENILFIYGHWMGQGNTTTHLYRGLVESKGRWNDIGYATRIIVSQVIGNEWEQNLGWGIYINAIGDNNGYVIPVIDFDKKIVEIFIEPAFGASFIEHFKKPIGSFTLDEYLDKMALEIWQPVLDSQDV